MIVMRITSNRAACYHHSITMPLANSSIFGLICKGVSRDVKRDVCLWHEGGGRTPGMERFECHTCVMNVYKQITSDVFIGPGEYPNTGK